MFWWGRHFGGASPAWMEVLKAPPAANWSPYIPLPLKKMEPIILPTLFQREETGVLENTSELKKKNQNK